MLILFDIDATLLTSSRAGVLALEAGGRETFGATFTIEGVDFAGRLDPLIIGDLLDRNGLERSAPNALSLRRGYAKHLPGLLARPESTRALPGVHALLAALRGEAGVTLGLLTGNFEDTGTAKLRSVGIEAGWFPVRVWGDESPKQPARREHLPLVAFERYRALHGRSAEPSRTVVIGDTPHDVSCALEHGCRSLGVATGSYTVEELRARGAARALSDLSDTAGVLAWLLEGAGRR